MFRFNADANQRDGCWVFYLQMNKKKQTRLETKSFGLTRKFMPFNKRIKWKHHLHVVRVLILHNLRCMSDNMEIVKQIIE